MAANNFVLLTKDYKEMDVPAPSGGVVAGDMRKIGDTIGIFVTIVAATVVGAMIYETEKIIVPKSTGVTFTAGDIVYFDDTAKAITSVPTANTACGRARKDGATGDTTLEINLSGAVAA